MATADVSPGERDGAVGIGPVEIRFSADPVCSRFRRCNDEISGQVSENRYERNTVRVQEGYPGQDHRGPAESVDSQAFERLGASLGWSEEGGAKGDTNEEERSCTPHRVSSKRLGSLGLAGIIR